jgi:hypothetical protein
VSCRGVIHELGARGLHLGAALVTVLALTAPLSSAGELPEADGLVHEGVATCAGSPCHGKTKPVGEIVLQNESRVWAREDRHANAYATLRTPASRRMAGKLGLKKPAHESDLCLDCHADNVPKKLRGKKFDIEEGVGCEACHGGSQKWLEEHASGTSHTRNLEMGMYPTDRAESRAKLCISCHFGSGSSGKFVNHRLMGSGHPRRSFELYVFTQIQPPHFMVDADYLSRGKVSPTGVEVWAIGQAVLVRETLSALLDERARSGLWPEFVLFDCHACHHAMSEKRWRPRRSTGLGPGRARLNDSSFLMLMLAGQQVDLAATRAFAEDLLALHQATSEGRGGTKAVVERTRDRVDGLIRKFRSWKVTPNTARILSRAIARAAQAGEFIDYAAAEQATLAMQVLIDSLYSMGALNQAKLDLLNSQTEKLLAATRNEHSYDPGDVPIAAFKRISDLLN